MPKFWFTMWHKLEVGANLLRGRDLSNQNKDTLYVSVASGDTKHVNRSSLRCSFGPQVRQLNLH